MRDTSGVHVTDDHGFLIDESIGDLDLDLVRGLVALNSTQNQSDECNQPTGSIIISAAAWFAAGLTLWIVVGLSI